MERREPLATAEPSRNFLLEKDARFIPETCRISKAYLAADFLHTSTQLKQAMHRALSIFMVLGSIHPALHDFTH